MIKKCPFCGRFPKIEIQPSTGHRFVFDCKTQCQGCGVYFQRKIQISPASRDPKHDAEKQMEVLWNRRYANA